MMRAHPESQIQRAIVTALRLRGLIVVAIPMIRRVVPSHVNETTETVDNLGGVISVVMVGAIIIAILAVAVAAIGASSACSATCTKGRNSSSATGRRKTFGNRACKFARTHSAAGLPPIRPTRSSMTVSPFFHDVAAVMSDWIVGGPPDSLYRNSNPAMCQPFLPWLWRPARRSAAGGLRGRGGLLDRGGDRGSGGGERLCA